MKNINQKWFYFNPLFVLYTDTKSFIKELKHYNTNDPINNYFFNPIDQVYLDPFDYDVRQMDQRDSVKMEAQMVNHQSAKRLRQQFAENETFEDFLYTFRDDKPEKLPVALITFVLSLFVATDFELRHGFYDLYQGQKIPAITQWSFQTFRVGPIRDTEMITDFRFIDDEYWATQYCCGLAVSFTDKTSIKERLEEVVAWFSVWEEHFNSDEKPYMEYVDFKRVSRISTEKNYLCGLTVEDQGVVTSSETGYFNQLSSDQKKIYIMLARVLDGVCVLENTELPIPHKNLLERAFDEQVMTAKLIRFIVWECKRFLN